MSNLIKNAAELSTDLMPHQERIVSKIQNQPGLVVFHGLGSGKTLSSIAAAVRLDPGKTKVLVPASLQENYKKELQKHTRGLDSNKVEVISLQGATTKSTPLNSDLLIVDEAHRARNPSSKAFKQIMESGAKKRLLLSASPIYNQPEDLAAVVNLAAGESVLPTGSEFRKKYIKDPPKGLMALLPFVNKEREIKNKKQLAGVLNKWVDYHESKGGDFPAVEVSRIVVPMSKEQTRLHNYAWNKLDPISKIRLRVGLPPEKKDLPALNSFQSQTRQVSGSVGSFGLNKLSPKIDRAFNDFKSEYSKNENHKAVVYSNYLNVLNDYSNQLDKNSIPYAIFSGKQTQKQKKEIISDFNSNKIKALLVSSAGGEGLDLKGTRQVQILEPHWNDEKLKQVMGRAIRHGSHSGLPEDERKVKVQRYEAAPVGLFGLKKDGIEQILYNMSANKEKINKEIIGLLEKNQGIKQASADAFFSELEKIGYKLQGHRDFQGLRIAIENRKGSIRSGTDSDGNRWRTKMVCPYGYIVGTEGRDGDPVDVFIGPNEEAKDAFVVHQHKDDGTGYDEDKIILGVDRKDEAKNVFLKHYDDPKFLGPVSKISIEKLKELIKTKKKLTRIGAS